MRYQILVSESDITLKHQHRSARWEAWNRVSLAYVGGISPVLELTGRNGIKPRPVHFPEPTQPNPGHQRPSPDPSLPWLSPRCPAVDLPSRTIRIAVRVPLSLSLINHISHTGRFITVYTETAFAEYTRISRISVDTFFSFPCPYAYPSAYHFCSRQKGRVSLWTELKLNWPVAWCQAHEARIRRQSVQIASFQLYTCIWYHAVSSKHHHQSIPHSFICEKSYTPPPPNTLQALSLSEEPSKACSSLSLLRTQFAIVNGSTICI